MKPSFALSLSFDGIALLHRAAGGWRSIGEVPLDSADLAGDLAALRDTATALTGQQMRTKLIIPDDQIKYMTLATGSRDIETRLADTRTALIGATPYEVADLAFDISEDGPVTHVAAVAAETLGEAESFAVEHGFDPVSFVAAPKTSGFLGEPWFGETRHARGLLAEGETVEADGIAVVVTGPYDQAPATAIVESAPDDDVAPDSAPPASSAPDIAAQDDAGASQDSAAAQPDEAAPDLPEAPADAPPAESAPETTPEPEAQSEPEPTEPAMSKEPVIGFSSRRTAGAAPALSGATRGSTDRGRALAGEDRSTTPGALASVAAPSIAAASAPPPAPAAPSETGTAPEAPRVVPTPGVIAPGIDTDDGFSATPPPPRGMAETLTAAPPVPATRRLGGLLGRRKAAPAAAPATGQPRARHGTPAPTAAQTPRDETDRMTVFGARPSQQAAVGGKPRFLGLILTAMLLLFLAGVAAWAAVFNDTGLSRFFGQTDAVDVAIGTPQPAMPGADGIAAPQQVSLPLAPTERPMPADPPQARPPAPDPDTAPAPQAEPAPPPPEAPAPVPRRSLMTLAEVEAHYTLTGIWLRAPRKPDVPAVMSLEDVYIAALDPDLPLGDAVALPRAVSYDTDLFFGTVSSPMAADTEFVRDARGLILATAEGALDPEGFTVYLGRPPLVPPPTPARAASEPEVNLALAVLPDMRPRIRPGGLAETNQRSLLGGLTLSELARIRPRLRPDVPPEALRAPQEEDTATGLAVVASIAPNVRPRDFDNIVDGARTDDTPAPAPRTTAPDIPTTASVARQATVSNAINLKRVNLIGVYGTPSNRRALVRLPSGRYKKVQVGDTVDGGRVSAIGDSDLRYQKGGRSVTLTIPSS
ncbi:MAG: hypothetical protein NXH82_08980 [Rhodobacteraceae bacterium]|nr:hypothetical protein [Paracoccaceae bacterium]